MVQNGGKRGKLETTVHSNEKAKLDIALFARPLMKARIFQVVHQI